MEQIDAPAAWPAPERATEPFPIERAVEAGPVAPSPIMPAPVMAPQARPVVAEPVPLPPLVAPLIPPVSVPSQSLVAPAAAASAAANSVGALLKTLASERSTAVSRGGPTIEDLVRDEMRPLLAEWLDTHLPGMVERLVRAEIERVMSRH